MKKVITKSLAIVTGAVTLTLTAHAQLTYPVVGTNQTNYYDTTALISTPSSTQPFYGQDAMYPGNVPSYADNGDGTITDNVTGLMWEKTADRTGDGLINQSDKMLYSSALSGASTCTTGGYSDWRLPTIKELYSLIIFSGVELAPTATTTAGGVPFINTTYFVFGYGDTASTVFMDDRFIDAQYATQTLYVANTTQMFGVNFADGRIKTYPTTVKPLYVKYVRGNTSYGTNSFVDNGDGTITDSATGLMWTKSDNGTGVLWQTALSFAESNTTAGYTDWRLPDPKELQSIVDYTRSPNTTSSAAINSIFNCTSFTNEGGQTDWGFFWTNTTHASATNDQYKRATYISFGRTLGYIGSSWQDVHGAGAQRSDYKTGDPGDYPFGFGPQGDAVRIYNYVRLVRNSGTTGINENNNQQGEIKIYPNPASEQLTIVQSDNQKTIVKITNTLGETVKEVSLTTQETIIDISYLTQGFYLYQISDLNGNILSTGKIIKQ